MRTCGYCGQANQDDSAYCGECGCQLADPRARTSSGSPVPQAREKKRIRSLDATSATVILFGWLAAQALCSVFTGIIAALVIRVAGGRDPQSIFGLLQDWRPVTNLLTAAVAWGVVIALAVALIPKQVRDRSHTGAAWAGGDWKPVVEALIMGAFLGLLAHFLIKAAGIHIPYRNLGPLGQMASTPGSPRFLWAVGTVLLAPPAEEMLFRGALYGGYRKTFGPHWAAVATTLIFAALHTGEAIHFPPVRLALALAIHAITGLAALWCRLRSSAIGPAIALHAGYNTVAALMVVSHSWH